LRLLADAALRVVGRGPLARRLMVCLPEDGSDPAQVRSADLLTYHASRAEAADRPDDWHTDAYFTEVRQQGHQPSQRFDMRIDPASLGVAQRLRVEEGDAVVVRRMIRLCRRGALERPGQLLPDGHRPGGRFARCP
jgi:hypothetical protein